jgi:hypothetical protein
MEAWFTNVGKRRNSTYTPSVTSYEDSLKFDVVLKDNTNVQNPVISLIWSNNRYPPQNLNYVFIPLFGRSYFVENVTFERNRVFFTLSTDVLGSFWGLLKKSTQYVIRSASKYNSRIIDTSLPILAKGEKQTYEIDNTGYVSVMSEGWYVVGIIGAEGNAVGAVSYYVMTQTQFTYFRSKLLTDYSYMGVNVAEISAELLKAIVNPFQYIVSCRWYPIKPPTLDTLTTVKVSGWELAGTSARLLSSSTVTTKSFYCGTGYIKQDEWKNCYPYRQIAINLAPWGYFQVDTTSLTKYGENITIRAYIDFTTGGSIAYYLCGAEANKYHVLGVRESQFGVDIQLAQTGYGQDVISIAGSVAAGVGGVGAAILGNAKALNSVTDSINNIATSMSDGFGSVSSFSANASIAKYAMPQYVDVVYTYTAEQNAKINGRPLCATVKLETLSGYTLINNPDTSAVTNCYGEERDELTRYMQSGFYIEEAETGE